MLKDFQSNEQLCQAFTSQFLLDIKLDLSFAFLGLQLQVLLLEGIATGGNVNKHMKRQGGQHIKRRKGP